ncbi:Soyasapogenol B glucuronide galactosyltransferase protein [Dioscorea alata]|uniref:Soyasapogenol B glucuronide galactosyltransferase protein n=1 Tax=Dioscorea alata TaxID=55571 RepID=A0ACB7TVR7_DIOAL|nr:Soyasapogenol B glucuronide galactosyltransferase protein [Dioscorea alata]
MKSRVGTYNPRTAEEVLPDFRGRRVGLIKALTTSTCFQNLCILISNMNILFDWCGCRCGEVLQAMLTQTFEQILRELQPNVTITDAFVPWTIDNISKLGIPHISSHGPASFFSTPLTS